MKTLIRFINSNLKFNFSNTKKVAEPAPDLNENKKEILKLLKD